MIKPGALTTALITKLRDSQPVTESFKPIYRDCVRALGTDPATGHFVSAPGIERAKQRVCRHLNGIASGMYIVSTALTELETLA